MEGILLLFLIQYNKITWTTGTASSGNETGLGGTPAQVESYFSVARRDGQVPYHFDCQVLSFDRLNWPHVQPEAHLIVWFGWLAGQLVYVKFGGFLFAVGLFGTSADLHDL